MRYQDVRLSKHFILLDFMHMREVYRGRVPLPLEAVYGREHHENGLRLCANLLEPMIDRFGPCSVSAGFTPQAIVDRNGWLWPQPHRWTDDLGAAADCSFHNWVNAGHAPIHLCERLDKEQAVNFDRLITYCGSEYICITYREQRNRKALYENVRIPGQHYKFTAYGTYPGPRSKRLTMPLPDRPDWRAAPGEIQSYADGPRPHHTKVGSYFQVLDFCRSERALREGLPYVLPWFGPEEPQVRYCRMFAEVLDPLVEALGRISVVKGMLTKSDAAADPDGEHHRWIQDAQRIEFVLPQGTDEATVEAVLQHDAINWIEFEDHPSQSTLCRLSIDPFVPAERALWVDAAPRIQVSSMRVRTRERA